MRAITWIAAAFAAVTLAVPAQAGDDFEQLARELQLRARALGPLVERLGTKEGSQALAKAFATGAPEDFANVYAGIELPVHDRCAWVRDLVDVLTLEPQYEEQCRLRDDLSNAERIRYVMIAMKYGHGTFQANGSTGSTGPNLQLVSLPIPPGPFLDELKANGLVDCQWVTVPGAGSKTVLGTPYHWCPVEHP